MIQDDDVSPRPSAALCRDSLAPNQGVETNGLTSLSTSVSFLRTSNW